MKTKLTIFKTDLTEFNIYYCNEVTRQYRFLSKIQNPIYKNCHKDDVFLTIQTKLTTKLCNLFIQRQNLVKIERVGAWKIKQIYKTDDKLLEEIKEGQGFTSDFVKRGLALVGVVIGQGKRKSYLGCSYPYPASPITWQDCKPR